MAKKRAPKKAAEKKQSVLESLMKAASAYYAGDVWSPGVQLAYLADDDEYYAALHRYPKDPDWSPGRDEPPKRVVAFKFRANTIEEAILGLAKSFSEMVAGAVGGQRELASSIVSYLVNIEDD